MKKTLTTEQINKLVAYTITQIEAKKGTNSLPYIELDFSILSPDTLEALKEAFVASDVHFEDRWNDGSDFVINVPVECAPGKVRSGRRDAGTVDPRNPMHDSVHQSKMPSHLGRRDAGTVDPGNPMHDSVHVSKMPSHLERRDAGTVDPRNPMRDSVHQPNRPSLDSIIKEATTKASSAPVNNRNTYEAKEI